MSVSNILLIDDDSDCCLSLARALKALGLNAKINAVSNPTHAISMAREIDPFVCVLDLCLDEKIGVESGFTLLRAIVSEFPRCRVIVLTGHGATEFGIRAVRDGAGSFVEKPANIQHLAALIQDGIRYSELGRALDASKSESKFGVEHYLVGESDSIKKVREAVAYAAQSSQAVIIRGETGTGKGVCAMAIHRASNRANASFVRYQPNFASSDLVNSDLFGHLKGSFTGAVADRKGLIAEAHQGTLFLDEIDELPIETQVTLLGVLQERRYRRLGSNQEELADFRLISASNRNLEEAISRGRLRADLYHRIAHVSIHMPPLRDRPTDIKLLALHTLKNLREAEQVNVFEISSSALAQLEGHKWPGNVRELEAVIEGGAYRTQYQRRTVIEPQDIHFVELSSDIPNLSGDFASLVEAYKIKLIEDALTRHSGNQVHAAAELSLDRSTMRRILKRAA